MASALQRRAPAFEPRILDPVRIQTAPFTNSPPSNPSHFPEINGSKIQTQVTRIMPDQIPMWQPLGFRIPSHEYLRRQGLESTITGITIGVSAQVLVVAQ